MSEQELVVKNESNIIQHPATPAQESPAEMMIRAKEAGLDAEQMKQMLDVQKSWEENESLKAFNLAISEFRDNPPKVYKDKLNKQYDSSYVSIGNMVNTVSNELSKYGLSVRWSFTSDETNKIICTCTLSHKLGHSESATTDGPPDESGKKNALQARKSTRTYLKLESFEAVTGMASVEAGMDDDGNSYSTTEYLTTDQITVINDLMKEVGADEGKFLKYLNVETIDKCEAQYYDQAIKALEAKRK